MKKINKLLFIVMLAIFIGCRREDKEQNNLPEFEVGSGSEETSGAEKPSEESREQDEGGGGSEKDTEACPLEKEAAFRETLQQFVAVQRELYPERKYFEQDMYFDNGTAVYTFHYGDITLIRDNRFDFVYEKDGKKLLLDGMGYETAGAADLFNVYLYDMTGDGRDDIVIYFDARGYNVLHVVDVERVECIPVLYDEEKLCDRVAELLKESGTEVSADSIQSVCRVLEDQIYIGGFAFCENMSYLWCVDWLCEYTEDGFVATGEPRVYRTFNRSVVSSGLSYCQHHYKGGVLEGDAGRIGAYCDKTDSEILYFIVLVNGVPEAGWRFDTVYGSYTEMTRDEVEQIQLEDYELLDLAAIQ